VATGLILFLATSVLGVDDRVPDRLNLLPASIERPVLIKFHGPIDYRRAAYLRSKINWAKSLNADLIVLEIDSPGGLKDESLDLAEMLRDIQTAYTVAFIPREALSGAALIALGTDQIVAGPAARIGDIGVIGFDPQLFAFRFAPAKVFSVLVRQARDIAESKGRPPDLAEAMIDKDVLVYRRLDPQGRPEFQTRRVNPDQEPEATLDGGWQLVPESGKERFLTLSGVRALELGIAQANADSLEDLNQLIGLTVPYRVIDYTLTDSVVYWLNTPWLTALLIIVGLVALYIELAAPGIGAGAMVSGLCALLFFWSRFLGGTSGILEVLLFVAGIAFLLMEIFVIPGWGLSGLLGIVLMMVSAIMASQNFVVPSTEREWNTLLTSLAVLLGSTFVVLIIAAHITRRLGKIPLFNRLVLAVPTPDGSIALTDKESGKPQPVNHPPVSVGDWGFSESLLRPAGRARFGRTVIDVVSDGSFIDQGVRIRVTAIDGNRIVVVEVDPIDGTQPRS
jgi:membrane-bound serine protease (ClpP class)